MDVPKDPAGESVGFEAGGFTHQGGGSGGIETGGPPGSVSITQGRGFAAFAGVTYCQTRTYCDKLWNWHSSIITYLVDTFYPDTTNDVPTCRCPYHCSRCGGDPTKGVAVDLHVPCAPHTFSRKRSGPEVGNAPIPEKRNFKDDSYGECVWDGTPCM